jgi:hypothetical protein
MRLVVLVQLIIALSVCSTWSHASILSYTNVQKSSDSLISNKASFEAKPDCGDPDMLMILVLSGGGSRSATYPGAFNSITLLDYSEDQRDSRYVHVFDGGNVDNLGLISVLKIIDTLHVNNTSYDKLADFFVDTNIIDATDNLLVRNRKNLLEKFKQEFNTNIDASQSVFYHLQFSDIEDIVLRKNCMELKPVLISNPKGRILLIAQSNA